MMALLKNLSRVLCLQAPLDKIDYRYNSRGKNTFYQLYSYWVSILSLHKAIIKVFFLEMTDY